MISQKIINNILGKSETILKTDYFSKDLTKIKIGDVIKYKNELNEINTGKVIKLYPGTSNPYEVKETSTGANVRVYKLFVIGII